MRRFFAFRFIVASAACWLASPVLAQTHTGERLISFRRAPDLPALRRLVTLTATDTPLEEVLDEIARQADLTLGYATEVLPTGARVSLRAIMLPAAEALAELLDGTTFDVRVSRTGQAVLVRAPSMTPPRPPATREAQQGTITGRVTEAASGVGIAGAIVQLEETSFGAVTGNTGRYRIAGVPAGTYTVLVRQLGYAEARTAAIVGDERVAAADFALEISAVALDEVVATGTAFETRRRTVPNPINVLTAREIEQKQANRLVDLVRGEIPGVIALSEGNGRDHHTPIYVRGNGSWSTADGIKVYIDGVEIAGGSLTTIDPTSINRIEIVRGPQASVIYGSNAASGVLQIFTKSGQPGLGRPRLDVQASLGTIESDYTPSRVRRPLTQDHSLQVSGGSDALTYRAGASYVSVGEWLTNYGSETLSFSGGLRAVEGPLTIALSALWSERDLDYANSPIYWNYPSSEACSYCGQPDLDYPNDIIGLSQNTMGLTLGYRATERWQHTLILGEDRHNFALHQPEPTFLTPADTFVYLSSTEYRRRSIRYHTAYEAELGRTMTGRITAGADYYFFSLQGSSGNNLGSAVGRVETTENTSATFQNDSWWNAGYFAMAEVGFSDRFFVTLAARAEDNPNLGEDYGLAVSPRIGASFVHEIGPVEMKLRAEYGKGVRPPPANAHTGFATSTSVYLPNPELGPEEKAGWDAGVDVHWGRSSFSVTRFDEEGQNLIQAVNIDPTATPSVYQYQNVGRVGSEGWEVETRVDVGPATIKANYAYSNNVIRELSNQYTSSANGVYQIGDRMTSIPTHSGGGTVTWRFWRGNASMNASVIDDWRGLDSRAYFDYAYGGEPYRGAFRDYYVMFSDALWKWNLRAEQALTEQVTAFLRVDNVGNQQRGDISSLYFSPGRMTVLGVRFTY